MYRELVVGLCQRNAQDSAIATSSLTERVSSKRATRLGQHLRLQVRVNVQVAKYNGYSHA